MTNVNIFGSRAAEMRETELPAVLVLKNSIMHVNVMKRYWSRNARIHIAEIRQCWAARCKCEKCNITIFLRQMVFVKCSLQMKVLQEPRNAVQYDAHLPTLAKNLRASCMYIPCDKSTTYRTCTRMYRSSSRNDSLVKYNDHSKSSSSHWSCSCGWNSDWLSKKTYLALWWRQYKRSVLMSL